MVARTASGMAVLRRNGFGIPFFMGRDLVVLGALNFNVKGEASG
jgi:hypothetical protein